MSEDNKRVVLTLWESLTKSDFVTMAEICHRDVVYHGPAGEERHGRQAALDFAMAYKDAFPDLSSRVEQLVAEGDYVVARVLVAGTNTGPLMGMPATRKPVELRWVMNMMRLIGGQVVEEWEIFDQADLMRQLGIVG